MSAFNERLQPVRDLIRSKGLDAIILRRNPNLAWAIAGRVHVPTTVDAACFDLIITPDGAMAVTNAIEAPRLIAEEFPEEIEVKVIEWIEGRDSYLPVGQKVGSDQSGADRLDLGLELEMIRESLISEDVDRYKKMCVDSAEALGKAMKESLSSDREIDIAGRITQSLWRSDLEIAYLGVAGEDRVQKFRHALPTSKIVGNRVSASICAKRKGLIATITRIVTFGETSDSLVNEYMSLFNVEASMLDATIVGRPFSEPLNAAIAAYPLNGFDADEWTKHHQGGPTGFLPRDWTANPTSSRLIQENQPIGWNPTGKGFKAEDTILATQSGVEILSIDRDWPSFEVNGRTRPFLLKK